ncbi:aspartate:alanine exchanger family transporter [Corynebacterium guangdongense]|uniref:Transport protein n=1 Tax=Corynebacterium guangdongense TaxID=1783348 RepID=A0ABU1ZZ08_9CORY|nr:TrkA C-terminal domain-containing protein [Corynebacterium guangdongense]MDR7329623.1 putative transport protein [Corynebacterium guangdongense]WJZ18188.1 putative transporter [Corynebacterium guangdongense]
MTEFFRYLAEQPILLVFLLIGAGMALGGVRIRGVSLGAAAVLFLGIATAAAASSVGVETAVPPLIGTMGLVVFAFGIGNNSGVTFFQSLKTATAPVAAMVGVFLLAALLAWGLGTLVLGLDVATVAGTFAGAVTNTPALAAASEASGDAQSATVGYAVAYLFGVIGMMIVAVLVLRDAGNDDDTASPVVRMHMEISRAGGVSVAEIIATGRDQVQITRLRRADAEEIVIPDRFDILHPGDVVTVVGAPEFLDSLMPGIGRETSQVLDESRHDLDFRRITISRHDLAGRTVADLNEELAERWGARVSRVRRADQDQLAIPGYILELGDRVRVVAPSAQLPKISKFLGDSSTGLTDINPIALGLGLALGIGLGHIVVPIPGGGTFSLGAAAGVLIVALVMGRIGRIGRLVTTLPHSANTVLAELGLLLFLAQAGTNAGGQIITAFTGGSWWKILLLGVIITTVTGTGIALLMRRVMKIGATTTAGILGGAQTQPAVLAFVNNRTSADPRVALGYAMVYPAAMIAKILVAHVLASLG